MVCCIWLLVQHWCSCKARPLVKRMMSMHWSPPTEDPISKITLTPSQRALGRYLFTILALFLFLIGDGWDYCPLYCRRSSVLWYSISAIFPFILLRVHGIFRHLCSGLLWHSWVLVYSWHQSLMVVKILKSKAWGGHLILGSCSSCSRFLRWYIFRRSTSNSSKLWNFPSRTIQGYEYIELGRIWQWIEYIGILFWLVLMIRSIIGAFKQKGIKTSLRLHILRYHGRYLLWSRVILWWT